MIKEKVHKQINFKLSYYKTDIDMNMNIGKNIDMPLF